MASFRMDPSAPVGVFDSGVGGISVLKHLRNRLPQEQLLFCADSHHAPYGNKTPEFIRQRAEYLANFLIAQGAKALVVACNTATAAAIEFLRQRYTLPIIGMEPAVKPAAAASHAGVIGVLATSGTLQSAQFAALLETYGRDVKVVTQACHGLVEAIESGDLNTPVVRGLVGQYVRPLLAEGADTIVLGCTHYPFIRSLIQEEAGADVTLIDTGEAVARQLEHRLKMAELLGPETTGTATTTIWVNRTSSDQFLQTSEVIASLWEGEAQLYPLPNTSKYKPAMPVTQ